MEQRGRRVRRDDGATTAEYVGIVALVAALAVVFLAVATPVSGQARDVVAKAYCEIGKVFGGGSGCTNSQLPGYIPRDCQISSTEKEYGGSVSVVATVGGDTGYTLYRIRTRQDDGSYDDTYVVKTNGEGKLGLEFGSPGGEVEAGGGKTGEGAKVTVEGSFKTGKTFTFDSRGDADEFIDKYKDHWGALGGLDVDGGPDADSQFYELGGKAELSGTLGPFDGKGGGTAVLGMEEFKNGDRKFSLALSAEAALDLGIPVPETIMQASAHGEVSLAVQADVTFDKSGNVKAIQGQIGVKAEADGGVDFQDLGSKDGYQGKHRKEPKVDLEHLELPNLPHLAAGASATLTFHSDFDDPTRTAQLSDALSNLVTGQGVTDEQKAALHDQINNHSQITFNLNNYSHDEEKWGGKVHFVITVGAEGHVNTTEEDVINGWYYNPELGTWQQNVACAAGS